MRISIISPSYNQSKYLELMTNSVLTQTHQDYEHLIFDPGSTDGSRQILSKYAFNNKLAKLFFEPDTGQISAINKGFVKCTGEILTWLNSDDCYYDSRVLGVVSNYFEQHPDVDIAYGRGLRVNEKGEVIRSAFVHPQGSNFLETLEHSLGILQPSLFFRRHLYERFGGLDPTWPLQLDYELWIRFAQGGCNFGFIDANLSKATVHSEAKSTKFRQNQLSECLELVCYKFGIVATDWIDRFSE
jgi:glycosyltransferase involved in cell wall biosynthesis